MTKYSASVFMEELPTYVSIGVFYNWVSFIFNLLYSIVSAIWSFSSLSYSLCKFLVVASLKFAISTTKEETSRALVSKTIFITKPPLTYYAISTTWGLFVLGERTQIAWVSHLGLNLDFDSATQAYFYEDKNSSYFFLMVLNSIFETMSHLGSNTNLMSLTILLPSFE